MIPDTRLTQMRELAEDIQTLTAAILDETSCVPLTRVRHYMNWVASAIDDAEQELA